MVDTIFHPARLEQTLSSIQDKKIILYGAGKICRLVVKYLERHGKKIDAIWDRSPSLVERFPGYTITEPNPDSISSKDDYVLLVTIYSSQVAEGIARGFKEQGFEDIQFEREVFGDLLFADCSQDLDKGTFKLDHKTCHTCPKSTSLKERCKIFDHQLLKERPFSVKTDNLEDMVVMDKLGFLIHNKCNLKCNGCNHLRDLYDDKQNETMPTEQILDDLRKVSDAVDFIDKLVLVGGEAFLRKNFDEILLEAGKLENVGIIQIITNGTIVPKKTRVFDVMAERNVIVEISGYGDNLTNAQKAGVQRFITHLEERNIEYQFLQTLSWFNFGDFEHRHYNRKKWQEIYEECCFISNDLFDGKLHKCSRGAFANDLKLIKNYKNDYIDVRRFDNPKDLRQAIKKYLKNNIPMVCQHCNGTTADTIPAGVQFSE